MTSRHRIIDELYQVTPEPLDQRSGRFETSLSRLLCLSEEMVAAGRAARCAWLCLPAGSPTPQEVSALALEPRSSVHRLDRLCRIDGIPLIIEFATVPEFCFATARRVQGSLHAALAQGGFRPVRAVQRLRAITLEGEQADRLGVHEATGGLLVERVSYLADGRPIEFTRAYCRGDAVGLVVHLTAPDPWRGVPAPDTAGSQAP